MAPRVLLQTGALRFLDYFMFWGVEIQGGRLAAVGVFLAFLGLNLQF